MTRVIKVVVSNTWREREGVVTSRSLFLIELERKAVVVRLEKEERYAVSTAFGDMVCVMFV